MTQLPSILQSILFKEKHTAWRRKKVNVGHEQFFLKKNSFIDYQATQFFYDASFICREAMNCVEKKTKKQQIFRNGLLSMQKKKMKSESPSLIPKTKNVLVQTCKLQSCIMMMIIITIAFDSLNSDGLTDKLPFSHAICTVQCESNLHYTLYLLLNMLNVCIYLLN